MLIGKLAVVGLETVTAPATIPSPILAVVIPWRKPVPLGPTTEMVVDWPAASDAGVTEVKVIGPEEATRNPPAKTAVSVPVLAVMV
jgi:hypothetical protein